MALRDKKNFLENLYRRYNRREFVHPDPLEFLYAYTDAGDREITGLIASSLAYGRVTQILKSVSVVLDKMGRSPRYFIENSTEKQIKKTFIGFKHRFTTADELSGMLLGVKHALQKHKTLEKCFTAAMKPSETNVSNAICGFITEITGKKGCGTSLLPSPARKSAFKRVNLFLRWMVRKDAVDPGGWTSVCPAKLIVPLDTHMHRIGRKMGFTIRKQGDLRTALEITEAFRKFSPSDPVKYDFCLTRTGIRSEKHIKEEFTSVFK